ncbi:MAG: Glutamine--fructose-6-phosphate aminotransferase [isomerizing] [Candidatus Woesearchaeota archaeon]|nr:Glutamine--fructose-6-phosphate aminotransferase [isomerizing] [Candidatus Woesearchaeota archaeon]
MCGIIAYKGKGNATDIVIEGLKRLEYRGYDSWGIATFDNDLQLIKKVGKIGKENLLFRANLTSLCFVSELLWQLIPPPEGGGFYALHFDTQIFRLKSPRPKGRGFRPLDILSNFNPDVKLDKSNIALGHTRWATHGSVTMNNAHPQTDCNQDMIVVHNGIIENYQEIKKTLSEHKFISDTDTEVIAHFLEEHSSLGVRNALIKLGNIIQGRNAIVLFHKPSEKLFAIRKGAPIVVGVSDKGHFIASDIPAFIEHTNKIVFLDNDEGVEINNNIEFFDNTGKEIRKDIEIVNWDVEQAQKGDYENYTIKEIMQQPDTIEDSAVQDSIKVKKLAKVIDKAYGSFLIGCGTASYAALLGTYYFSKIAKKHINFLVGSEFSDHQHFLTDKSLVIAVSQSGETADTLDAVETAKKHNSKVASIVNVMGSSLTRISDYPILMNAGPEISVVSTKAFTSQIAILLMLAYTLAGKQEMGKKLILNTAENIKELLNKDFLNNVERIADQLKNKKHIYVIGKGVNYPIALESALKIKEISYIHAEGFACGELKHGVIALIEEATPCIAIVGEDEHKMAVLSSAAEVKARGGHIIGVSPKDNEVFDQWIKVPDCGYASPIANVVPMQLLAYYLAKKLGKDPDKPRNLAKSVTVK